MLIADGWSRCPLLGSAEVPRRSGVYAVGRPEKHGSQLALVSVLLVGSSPDLRRRRLRHAELWTTLPSPQGLEFWWRPVPNRLIATELAELKTLCESLSA